MWLEDTKLKGKAMVIDMQTRVKNLVNDIKAHPKTSAAVLGGTIGALALAALSITGIALLEKHSRLKKERMF